MNLSSILVIAPSEYLQSTINALNLINGVEVHVCEKQSGRIIATQEAETIAEEVDGLKRIKSLPHILFAEMVFHYFENDSFEEDSFEEDSLDDSNQTPEKLIKRQDTCCTEVASN